MKINIRGYITHKESEKYSDCADRYAVSTKNNHFAIADGVSKSFYPDYWADILVSNFVALEKGTELSIEKCQSEWLERVKEKVNAPDVKWYTANAFNKQIPGLATLVTLRFENNKWFASALGDSFLFFVPKEKIGFDEWVKLSSKPEPVVFDSYPDYYSSRKEQHGETKRIENDLTEGTFYLMTDALSEWVFSKKEEAVSEINEKWHSQEEFERSIAELRSLKVLNDDDSAILIIEIEDDGSAKLAYEKEEIQSLDELVEKEKSTESGISVDKEEDFIEEIKVNIKDEKILKENTRKKITLSEKTIKSIKKELKKLSEENQKKVLINLCEQYDFSLKD